MKKLLLAFLIIANVLVLSGCGNSKEEYMLSNYFVSELNEIEYEGSFFYNVYNRSISFWNSETNEVLNKTSWNDERFKSVSAYSFIDADINQYSIGDSYQGSGCIFENDGDSLKVIYSCPDSYLFIHPFFHDEKNSYYAVEKYADETQKTFDYFIVRVSATDTGATVLGRFEMAGPPLHGVEVENEVYFTVYDYDTETYSLYTWELDDTSMSCELVKSNLEEDNVYLYDSEVICSDDGNYQLGEEKFSSEKGELYQFNNVFVYFPNDNTNEKVKLFDPSGKTKIMEYEKVLGFSYVDGVLNLYSLNGTVYNYEVAA